MMKSVFIINFVIALFLYTHLASCGNEVQRADTLVEVQLLHKPQRIEKIYLYAFPDSFSVLHSGKVLIDSFPGNEKGVFFMKLPSWKKADFIDLAISTEPLCSNLFLVPGQHLTLQFDCSQTPAILSNRNSLDDYNRFLQEFSDTFYRNPVAREFYYAKSNYLLAPDYAKYIDQRHQQELSFSNAVRNDTTLDRTFRSFLQYEIDYQWANDKIAFLWKKWIRNEEVPVDSGYYNFLKVIKVDNPDALHSPAYWRFLQLYIREMHRQLPLDSLTSVNPSYAKCHLAQKLTSGVALKIALLHILNNEMDNARSLGVLDQARVNTVKDLAQYMVTITNDRDYVTLVNHELKNR